MQTPENNRERENEALEAPPTLISALKRLPQARVFIPATVDEAVMRTARRHLSQRTERGFKWSYMVRWGIAIAAVVLLLAMIPQFMRKPGAGGVLVRGDINHDGQVDILDAFALARELKAGAHPSRQLDINGDGVVDERDVAALAARAVSLGKGGGS